MTSYTVAVREQGHKRWRYIEFDGDNLRLRLNETRSKPLTHDEAEQARHLLVVGAAQLGLPIEARVVRLCGR